MKRITTIQILAALSLLLIAPLSAAADLAVRAERLFPGDGPVILNGVVLIEDGKIIAVGTADKVQIPTGVKTLDAATVTPGLVDIHSVVGLAGVYNSDEGQVQDQDQIETSSPLQPQLRAVDAYNPVEPLVEYVRSLGVTTIHSGHGPGAVISGQTLVTKTVGSPIDAIVIDPQAAVAATLTSAVSRNFESPGTHAKSAAMLREALVAAQVFIDDQDSEEPSGKRDRGKEALANVLRGETALMITAQTTAEIATALRLQKEFGFTLWIDGASEAYRLIEPIKASGAKVLLHATMLRAGRETKNASRDSAAKLLAAGIPFAIQTGFESYVPKTRVLLYEMQVATRYGLSDEQALEAVSLSAAKILGLDDRIGSLTVGKDADLVLFDGDPFEYTSHVCHVIIEGVIVSDVCR